MQQSWGSWEMHIEFESVDGKGRKYMGHIDVDGMIIIK
jgi:hypothetical protein